MRRSDDDDTKLDELDVTDLELLEGPRALRRPRPSGAWLRDWVGWFGPARLIACVVAVVGVAIAGWWLVRTPPAPTEAGLPMSSTPSSTEATPRTVGDAPAEMSPPRSDAPSEVIVHVAGAVRHPGVYRLPPGSRVHDVVVEAGGFTRQADTTALNLAAALGDGSQVYVPKPGEEIPTAATPAPDPAASSLSGAGEAGADSSGDGAVGAPIDVNTAEGAELETLPGIGPVTAQAIVDHREAVGGFSAVDELEDVRGIGPATLDAIYDLVTV